MADMRDYAGTTLCVTEKIDGSNVRIHRGEARPGPDPQRQDPAHRGWPWSRSTWRGEQGAGTT